ncbi:protein TIC 100-like isoform X1 [Papaver somniferum]|uniref:protein TIC 100-like isoform X1 n=1 Tax=Papaver somniferum TaxID=3469 RepID=UPI000E6FC01C|nr:protein TIC 100-like isoform X1 [Papaver somniferum]
MAEEDSIKETSNVSKEEEEEKDSSSYSTSDSEYDSDADSDDSSVAAEYIRPGEPVYDSDAEENNTEEANISQFLRAFNSKRLRKKDDEEEKDLVQHEDLYDFPKDPENWKEEDIQELWGDAPLETTKPGWDPVWADDNEWDIVAKEIKKGRNPPIAPFYVPYRKYYPAIPDNHHDIANPKAVIEELDRIEEFLKWVSYIFRDGSSYEGTVWDDLANGKGVYVAQKGLVRYEGEWLQNNMEGHGVVEVDIPDIEPVPGSKLEAKMRAEGKIISRDFMDPEDREWLEMDIEDSYRLAAGNYETPFDNNPEWIKQFGQKPERGRYRYAGQWKHSRMHGCGVYEVNERPIYGRFYFGELLEDSTGCDEDTSALHAGIAEVAAAKARMFVNKPDGMVREQRGPYSDPQHPYLYEGEDVWMAPGFINQFYEVPDYWKKYVHDVDEEREMWLNSFYKAPLRIPMPAELEYWWSKDETPEFVVVKNEPEGDPEDASEVAEAEDPVILHTPTGRLINIVEDEEHGVRLYWQPSLKEREQVDLNKVEYLPLGFDEFFGRTSIEKKAGLVERLMTTVGNVWKPINDKLEKLSEEIKKNSELKLKLIEQELEFIEAELCLEETIEDMENELKRKQEEEEKKVDKQEVEDISTPNEQDGLDSAAEDEDEEGDDDDAPTSFGSVAADDGNKRGKSPFSTLSLSFASSSLVSTVPCKLQKAFVSWRNGGKLPIAKPLYPPQSRPENYKVPEETLCSVGFPLASMYHASLKSQSHVQQRFRRRSAKLSPFDSLSRLLSNPQASTGNKSNSYSEQLSRNHDPLQKQAQIDLNSVLSLHFPINCPAGQGVDSNET